MAARLSMCTKEEQRAVILFLWSEGVSGSEIHRRRLAQYGDSALLRSSVYEWIEMFKSGRTSVMHEDGAGRLLTSTADEKIHQARVMVMVNQRVIINEVARFLQISHSSAYQIIHDMFGFHKVCARWVSRKLTAGHKRKRLKVYKRLLGRYNNGGKEFLSRIVTRDET
ncbi:uncharacterized protein LOC106870141 [Octopus bimaculoides]|uniref:uncharacterized protein LOC106870141 n=1 Tax=Octopus bimaculoides TaxID=37653 RepID=UPI00071CB60A|nr:uncharacterized protein LOC106870141 [Octopus bimaculoides]|eukprot:XP_014771619.1 PREDICTED: uncharacterized protein LOC106870141 [Octopus bimaculoides]